MKALFATKPNFLRRAGALAAACVLLASALLICGCGKSGGPETTPSPAEQTGLRTEDGKAVYRDDYVEIRLSEGYFIAVDNTKNMGSVYHAYLMFKHENDFSGSQVVYYSMHLERDVYIKMVTDKASVVAQLKKTFESKGKTVELVDFENLTQEGCRGYIIEYKTGDGITQIIYCGLTTDCEFISVTFNCADESRLPEMREAAKSIRLITE